MSAVMQHGRNRRTGTRPRRSLTNPQQAYTRQLLDAAPDGSGILRISARRGKCWRGRKSTVIASGEAIQADCTACKTGLLRRLRS